MDSPPKPPSRTLSFKRRIAPHRSNSMELRPRGPVIELNSDLQKKLESSSNHSRQAPSRNSSESSLETVSLIPSRRPGRKRLRKQNSRIGTGNSFRSIASSLSGSLENLAWADTSSTSNNGSMNGATDTIQSSCYWSSNSSSNSSSHAAPIYYRRVTTIAVAWLLIAFCVGILLIQNVAFAPGRKFLPVEGEAVAKPSVTVQSRSMETKVDQSIADNKDGDEKYPTLELENSSNDDENKTQKVNNTANTKRENKKAVKEEVPISSSEQNDESDFESGSSGEVRVNPFELNARKVESFAQANGIDVQKVITAYTEPTFQDTVPGTGSRTNPHDKKDSFGIKPKFKIPLPRRTHTPQDLQEHFYPAARTCHDLPGKLPIDKGLQFDKEGNPVVWNLVNDATPKDFPETEAEFCPVELDPFLPWIHDVFASPDGTRIQFIAQNMRRCRTGNQHDDNVNRLIPQVTLLQSVSVQRVNETTARQLAPDLWHDHSKENDETTAPTRYRLAPHAEADADGMETRFICRFHMSHIGKPAIETVYIGETLSEYPFNYEFVGYRKNQPSLLSPQGHDGGFFWASNLHFHCPVPDNPDLRQAIANGSTVLSDGTATMHVDIVPIRTSVRYDETYLTKDQIGPKGELPSFDPVVRWGPDNVLPRIEASGRWENLPICHPPKPSASSVESKDERGSKADARDLASSNEKEVGVSHQTHSELGKKAADDGAVAKPHYLAACLWASAEFKTRGNKDYKNTDTLNRLREWIEFHLLAGVDHLYVYDNSGAHSNDLSLEPILQKYSASQVTRIDWPSTVCSNNKPTSNSPGERSSQYAAEASCRARYGPFTEWMASFDTDEYFVPEGNYTNLKDVLSDVARDGTNIVSFRSSRGKLRLTSAVETRNGTAIRKSPSSLFLEAYNCDGAGSPKPSWADRAKKQIYRPDYVLHHYVHYSTVTKGLLRTYREHKNKKKFWPRRYREGKPSEIYANELTQAVMVHTKSIEEDMTVDYKTMCRHDYDKKWKGCWVANPWLNGTKKDVLYDSNGMDYNCHVNAKVEQFWIPKLKQALSDRQDPQLEIQE